ncbi:trypsin [Fistulifera solaris]|uniref:Trypsin n=1 Tax=Fistulifera solaris TaxID=1519565 RepID=A0A1Z5K3Q6_FISSO|nr:trypsin [Fistulifera solaris]|eukprot:GAX20855.1 trypsin [Fistulifera solaris]
MRRLIWLSYCPWVIASLGAIGEPRGLSSTLKIGNDTFAITPRIVGGDFVSSADVFPYYVHGVDGDLCGGSLIHPEVVLSAAHCVKAYSTGVILRTLDWMGYDSTSEFYPIEYNFPHPEYTPGPELNDIMLIKLATPVVNAQVVQLHRNGTIPPAGTPATIMGFGLTSEGGNISTELKQATLEIVEQSTCEMLLPGLFVSDIHLCAGYPEGGQDSCGGDSGGPLVDAQDTNLQYGIVSFGIGCARPNLPGVYTRISSYIDWIDEFLCTRTDNPPANCSQNISESSQIPIDMPSESTALWQATSSPSSTPVTTSPTSSPSIVPSRFPSQAPSSTPSDQPSVVPSQAPSLAPSAVPSEFPSLVPSALASLAPSLVPTGSPKTKNETKPASPSVVSDLLNEFPASSSVRRYARFGFKTILLFIFFG